MVDAHRQLARQPSSREGIPEKILSQGKEALLDRAASRGRSAADEMELYIRPHRQRFGKRAGCARHPRLGLPLVLAVEGDRDHWSTAVTFRVGATMESGNGIR